jgi:hypothetical protein
MLMSDIKNITLKFPCNEDWNKMKVVNGERICSQCKHKVVDFTTMNNAEFQTHLQNPARQVCGRFKKSQLSNEFLKYAAAALIAASSLGAAGCESENALTEESIEEPSILQGDVEIEPVLAGIIALPYDSLMPDTTATESGSDIEALD